MKDLLTSKTIIGLLIAVLGPVAARYGIEASEVQSIVELVVAAAGGVLGVYGRVKASGPISSVAGISIR